MNRRDFLSSSAAATIAGVSAFEAGDAAAQPGSGGGREYYELRTYAMNPGGNQQPLLEYLHHAAIPALNRIGASKVGVFTELDQPEKSSIYVLIAYPSINAFIDAGTKLTADAAHQKAGAAYLSLPKSSAAYARVESSLMVAFEGMPKLVLPSLSVEKKPRIFELRIYESHSETAGKKKIEMFNKGEIEIMRRVGLGPVFYGETLVGTLMPNLTYLLSGENRDTHKQHWGAFGADPEWRKMSALPEYANSAIISRISNKFLAPVPFSQI
jgi:hypothetical protein